MTLNQIIEHIKQCSDEADRIELERRNTFLFFQQAIELNDGPAMCLARECLHAYMDAHFDNLCCAITLQKLLNATAA